MRSQMKMIDATKPLTISIKQCHLDGARKRDPENCMLAKALKQEKHVEKAAVHRNVVWIKFKGQDHITRYQSTPATRTAVAAFDKTLTRAVKLGIAMMPKDGWKATLRPPRPAISMTKLRSEKMKAIRKASAKKRKGTIKRPHKTPDSLTLEGVRSSQGYHL